MFFEIREYSEVLPLMPLASREEVFINANRFGTGVLVLTALEFKLFEDRFVDERI